MMSGIHGRDTRPEMLVRRYLHGQGFRYRLHVRSLQGKPDIVLPKYRLVVFVHGCFWHRHGGCRFATTPASNATFWRNKFTENAERDRRNIDRLVRDGWRVVVIWECGIKTGDAGANLSWLPETIRGSTETLISWPN
jgi:DNA mismatch endonuclease, patch repair protein